MLCLSTGPSWGAKQPQTETSATMNQNNSCLFSVVSVRHFVTTTESTEQETGRNSDVGRKLLPISDTRMKPGKAQGSSPAGTEAQPVQKERRRKVAMLVSPQWGEEPTPSGWKEAELGASPLGRCGAVGGAYATHLTRGKGERKVREEEGQGSHQARGRSSLKVSPSMGRTETPRRQTMRSRSEEGHAYLSKLGGRRPSVWATADPRHSRLTVSQQQGFEDSQPSPQEQPVHLHTSHLLSPHPPGQF